jgi:Helix-turn-helix domain
MPAQIFTTAPVKTSTGLDAEFCDLHGLEARYGIRRSTAYNLIADGSIRSVCLRRRGQIKGKRLVDCASVREFLATQPTDIDPRLSENCRRAQKASASVKREALSV